MTWPVRFCYKSGCTQALDRHDDFVVLHTGPGSLLMGEDLTVLLDRSAVLIGQFSSVHLIVDTLDLNLPKGNYMLHRTLYPGDQN